MNSIEIRHNFETAHRLYDLGPTSKCWNLHGHSFWAELIVKAPALDARGMVVEYGDFKRAVRSYLDDMLDHGAVLNHRDPLVDFLIAQECKVFTLPVDPTVEALAAHLHGIATAILRRLDHAEDAWVAAVTVQETHVNAATYQP